MLYHIIDYKFDVPNNSLRLGSLKKKFTADEAEAQVGLIT